MSHAADQPVSFPASTARAVAAPVVSHGAGALEQSVRLLVVGLNHRTAPLAIRETVAFSGPKLAEALLRLQERFPGSEAVILSTCNRVELYLARPVSCNPGVEAIATFLAEFHALNTADLHGHLYHREDRGMIEHLFSVASSLDSMVLGETQILAQVKQAYQTATAAGTAGKVFHALFQRALAAAKDVHDQTNLAAGHLSIASVAVDLARSVFDRFDDKTVVCVGAGEMASLLLTHLRELSPRRLLLTNRSHEKAVALAHEFKGEPVPFENLDDLLVEADIVLTSTGAPTAIIAAAQFRGLLKRRRYRPVVLVDIAVPRDVEAGVGELSNVYLYNIDDLQQVADANRSKRDQLVALSQGILSKHVEDFLQWFAARDVGPLVKALYAQCNAVAKVELEGLFAKNPQMDEAQRQAVEKLAHRLVQKILHTPVSQITQQTEATARPMLASALKKLFKLQDGPGSP